MYKLVPHRIVGCLPHSSLRQGRCLFLVLCHRASCRGSTFDIDFVIRSINQMQVWLPQTNWYVCERLGGNFHPFEKGFVWSCADARQLIHLMYNMELLLKGTNITRIATEPSLVSGTWTETKKYITVDFSWFWHMKDPPNLPDPPTKPNSPDPQNHTSYLSILGHHHNIEEEKNLTDFGPFRSHLKFHWGLPKESLRCDQPLYCRVIC